MEMMQVFRNEEFGEVRTVLVDGEPWFVAADVCRVLEIANHKDAITRLDSDEKSGVVLTDPHGREQVTNCVNEPGLYSLVIGSRKPQAKIFKRWITHEVRVTGKGQLFFINRYLGRSHRRRCLPLEPAEGICT